MAPKNPRTHALSLGNLNVGRPKQAIKRDKQLNLRFTAMEYETVRSRAEAQGLKPIDYGRAVLLDDRRALEAGRQAGSTIERSWLAQIRRLGNNANQIARRLNAFREPPPPSLEPLLAEIRELIRRSQS